MQFKIVQKYDSTSASDVARAFRSDGMYKSLRELPFVGTPELLSNEDADHDARLVKIRYRAAISLPAIAQAFVDGEKLSFVETSTVGPDGESPFTIVPDYYDSLLAAKGVMKIEDGGDGSCQRLVTGDVKVDLGWQGKMFEGQVEKIIVNGLTDYLHAEVAQVALWVKENPSG